MKASCHLCKETKVLKNSHYFPKFIFDWMKKTGGNYLRNFSEPNIRQQDGIKAKLLCNECEQKFSVFETFFANEFFYPYLNNEKQEFPYDDKLSKFLVSLLWRNLIFYLPNLKESDPFYNKLIETEETWRSYLLEYEQVNVFNEIHLYFTRIVDSPIPNLNTYLNRSIEGNILSSKTSCSVYCKFSRFILIGGVVNFDTSQWQNTKVFDNGVLIPAAQELFPGTYADYIKESSKNIGVYRASLSEEQKTIIDNSVKNNLSAWKKTDLARSILADHKNNKKYNK